MLGANQVVSPKGETIRIKLSSQKVPSPKPKTSYQYSNNGDNAEYIVTTEKRIITKDDAAELVHLDTKEWEVDRFKVGASEGYRKHRKVKWQVRNGKVIEGDVDDDGKMLLVTLHTVQIWVVRKTQEIRNRLVVDDLRKDARKFAPKYPRIKYPKVSDGLLYEIEMPDLQLGRLVLEEEAGKESSPDLYLRYAETAIDDLISYVVGLGIARILFPIGNDFFNSNTAEMKTAHGTQQQDDVRWQRTYALGKKCIVGIVDKLAAIAPVDILVIPGNHDEERVWYFGDTLSSWYHRCPNVMVDNRPIKRKYYQFNRNMICLTHGYYEKVDTLSGLLPGEQPQMWADTLHHEVHLGDLHHKSDVVLKTKELNNGVVVRVLRSLAPPSVWEFDKGYTGSLKATEGFLWHPERGLIGQFTGLPIEKEGVREEKKETGKQRKASTQNKG